MVRNGEIALADVKRVLRKYWWIPVLSTVVLSAVGYGATLVLPKKYTSSTNVLVEQPVVPADFVKPVVSVDLNARLASMKAQILSGSRLQPIVDKFGLFADQRGKASADDLIEQLQKSIEVELMQPMPGAMSRQPPGFRVSVTISDPRQAQQICTEITSIFMQQNAKRRIDQAEGTTTFLGDQLEQAKAKLDAEDAKLAQFKRQYLGSLPEEEQTNLSILNGLNTQLEATTQAMSRTQGEKALNETLLSQQEANWKLTQNNQQNPDMLDQQLTALQEQLAVLMSRYTAEHPDVIKLQTQIEDVKKRMSDEPAVKSSVTTRGALHEPAQLQQLRARIKQDDLTIADLTRRQNQLQEQIRLIQGRVQASPMVEEQFKELTRNHQAAMEFYNELARKHQTSAMATDLEGQQQSETFRVLDPPSYPSSPSFPKVPMFLGGGFGAGLALAVAVLLLLAAADKSMYSERDIEKYLKLPVIASIPSLNAMALGKTESRGSSSDFEAAVALKT